MCERSQLHDILVVTPRSASNTGSHMDMSENARQLTEAEWRRRLAVLDSLRFSATLRARLRPRAEHLARERALLHARIARG